MAQRKGGSPPLLPVLLAPLLVGTLWLAARPDAMAPIVGLLRELETAPLLTTGEPRPRVVASPALDPAEHCTATLRVCVSDDRGGVADWPIKTRTLVRPRLHCGPAEHRTGPDGCVEVPAAHGLETRVEPAPWTEPFEKTVEETLAAGGREEVHFRLARTCEVALKVWKHDGSPAADLPVRRRIDAELIPSYMFASTEAVVSKLDAEGAARWSVPCGPTWTLHYHAMDRSFEGTLDLENVGPVHSIEHHQPRPVVARIRAVDAEGAPLSGSFFEDPPPVSMVEPIEEPLPPGGALVRFTSMEDARTVQAPGFTERRVTLAGLGVETPADGAVVDVEVRLDERPPVRVFASLGVRSEVEWLRCHGPDGYSAPCDGGIVGYRCSCATDDRVLDVKWSGQDKPVSYLFETSPVRLERPMTMRGL